MRQTHRYIIGCALAAAVLLSGCSNKGSSSSQSSSSSGSTSASMGGVTSGQNAQGDEMSWKTGLEVRSTVSEEDRTGSIQSIAAAVLLDEEGRIVQVTLDEFQCDITADGSGKVEMPSDYTTKRQKGDAYPLANASSIKKGWDEQVDAFGDYLVGMTADEVRKVKTDGEGYPTDPDLVSGCTIKVNGYRDAVAAACENAQPLGAAKGDRLVLGVEAANGSSGDLTAQDDKNVQAQVNITVAVATVDAEDRITSALWDEAEPALTVASDGMMEAPDEVLSKLALGDSYGMRGASSLDKEWYEHSEGLCDYLKGKTPEEVQAIPDDGSQADLAALCTISITDLQKALLRALDSLKQT